MQIVRISWVSFGLFMPFRKSVRIFVRTVGESAEKMNFIPFRFETISLLHLSHFPQSILASFVHKKRAKHTHTHTKSGNIDFVDILAAVTVKLAICLAFVRNPICAGWICFFFSFTSVLKQKCREKNRMVYWLWPAMNAPFFHWFCHTFSFP